MLVTSIMHNDVPDVDICFDLVNRSPVGRSTLTKTKTTTHDVFTSWLCDVMVNQPEFS